MKTLKKLVLLTATLALPLAAQAATTASVTAPAEFNISGTFKISAKASCRGVNNTITASNKPFTGTLKLAAKDAHGDYPFTWQDSLQSHYSTGIATPHGKALELAWDNEYDTNGALAFLFAYQAANHPGLKHTFSATITKGLVAVTDRAYVKMKLPNGCSATYEAIKTAKSIK